MGSKNIKIKKINRNKINIILKIQTAINKLVKYYLNIINLIIHIFLLKYVIVSRNYYDKQTSMYKIFFELHRNN